MKTSLVKIMKWFINKHIEKKTIMLLLYDNILGKIYF